MDQMVDEEASEVAKEEAKEAANEEANDVANEVANEVANKEAKGIIKTKTLIVDINPQDRTPTVWCHLFLYVDHKHDCDNH